MNRFHCDLEVLWVELKQILHLKVGRPDFGPVWPCSGQGQTSLFLVLGRGYLILDHGRCDANPHVQLRTSTCARSYKILPLRIFDPYTHRIIGLDTHPVQNRTYMKSENVHLFLFKFIFIFQNHIQMEKMTKTVADYSELLVKTFDLPI